MFGYALREAYQSFLLAAQASPYHLLRLMFLNLLFGTGPAIILYLQKIIIDEITLSTKLPSGDLLDWIGSHPLLWNSIIGFVIINLLLDSIETIAGFEANTFRESVLGKIKTRMYKKIAEFNDIALFENPELLNTVQLALNGIPRLSHLSFILGNLLMGFFSFVPVFLLSFSITWWIPFVILILAIPSIYVQIRYEEEGWGVERSQAGIVRRMNISEGVLTQGEYAKELRLFQLQSLFLDRWRRLFWNAFDEMYEVRKKGTRVILLWSVLSGLGVGAPFIYIVWATINGIYTLGDLALYAGIVFQARRSLYVLIGNMAELHNAALGAMPIFQLLNLQASIQDISTPETNIGVDSGITINDLSFSYPNSKRQVLKDINLTIKPGETVAIVGKNGAGKTTLMKLICRLYDPQKGSIGWDGKDIRSIELETLRRNIAVVMQDYAKFPTTARENIGFGLLEKLNDDPAIMDAAEKSGLRSAFESLPDSLETPLTKQLENGTELSGGQWQRVALARALIRHSQAKLLILDEPTAALDPTIEHEIYNLFREMARNKMAVIISHRLALARTADKIIVIDEGEVVETGPHDELMAMNGLYCQMFTLQASGYLSEEANRSTSHVQPMVGPDH